MNKGKFGNIVIFKVNVVDILGVGDIFYGVFCYYIFDGEFIEVLRNVVNIVVYFC